MMSDRTYFFLLAVVAALTGLYGIRLAFAWHELFYVFAGVACLLVSGLCALAARSAS
jgi:hypothetical protein